MLKNRFSTPISGENAETPHELVGKTSDKSSGVINGIVRGLLGTGPPDPTLESAYPSTRIDLASKQGQIRKSMSNQCRIDVESMPNRPRGGEGEANSRVRSRGSVPNIPLTIMGFVDIRAP